MLKPDLELNQKAPRITAKHANQNEISWIGPMQTKLADENGRESDLGEKQQNNEFR